jgi:hypothetical protein
LMPACTAAQASREDIHAHAGCFGKPQPYAIGTTQHIGTSCGLGREPGLREDGVDACTPKAGLTTYILCHPNAPTPPPLPPPRPHPTLVESPHLTLFVQLGHRLPHPSPAHPTCTTHSPHRRLVCLTCQQLEGKRASASLPDASSRSVMHSSPLPPTLTTLATPPGGLHTSTSPTVLWCWCRPLVSWVCTLRTEAGRGACRAKKIHMAQHMGKKKTGRVGFRLLEHCKTRHCDSGPQGEHTLSIERAACSQPAR